MDTPATGTSPILQSHRHILPQTLQPGKLHNLIYIIVVPFNILLHLDILDLLKKAPTKHELLNLLASVSNLWLEIGLSLDVSYNILDCLRLSQESDAIKLSEVIHSWLTTTESHLVTWETVIDAIKGPIVNNIKKANEIYQYLTKGKLI